MRTTTSTTKTRTKRTKRKRTKTTTGAESRRAFLLLAGALLAPVAAAAQRSRKEAAPHAVIAGTIFRDPGFAVAGAEATLTYETLPPGVKKRPRPEKARTSGRGEFAFQVPAGQARYTLRASAPGLEPQERSVEIFGEERAEVYFNLKPLSK